MALFIVLWMMNTTETVRQSVSGYFKDPRGYTRTLGAGSGNGAEGLRVDRWNVKDVQNQIERALERAPEFKTIRKNVAFSATGEGLRIDLLETEEGLFFVTGQPSPTAAGERLLGMLAAEIGTMPNNVAVEGHTDALPFRGADPNRYGNWELSSDRAQAARRLLLRRGLRPEQVVEVRGFADRKLLNPKSPVDPRNRRVSLVVKFTGG
jgi:chemotaxis protein MotB